ncbi:carbohydrate binding domain-containing protein [Streptomyces sp. NBC_01794]|uniref:carbohydrate binding domain-containing protein n=1 Tax=Streptomyces sp. NBC_01794 TaxID=2975942 RepID=UPI003091BC0F|nr:carbohydrate binding domain-containing protein [Streptomyces sp. NBC_01794]
MARLYVEAAFGYTITTSVPVWTDVTPYVDLVAGVSNTRGSSDELSETQPGQCSLTLDNSDGRFSPGRASGAYYPNVKKNVPLRVWVITTAKNLVFNPSFEAGLTDWSKTASPTIVQDATHVQSGSQAMRVTWGSPTGQSVFTELYGLHIGARYTASAYVWIAATAPVMELHIEGMAAGSSSTTTGAFERLTYTFTATATHHRLVCQTVGTPTNGTQMWLDAVQCEDGATATTFDSDGAQAHARFCGMVNEWPVKWEGLHSKVTITCTDLFKWLQIQPELQAMLIEEVLLDRPIAYYPLSEPAESTSAGDLAGTASVGSLSIVQAGSGGTLTFAAGVGPSDGLGCPVFTPASSTAGKYLSADLGPNFTDANVSYRVGAEAWFSTSTTDRVLMALTSSDGSSKTIVSLESGTGKLQVQNQVEGSILASTVWATPNLADGAVHHFAYNEAPGDVAIDGTTYTMSNFSVDNLRILYVGGFQNARLWNGSIAHVALYLPVSAVSAITPHYTTGTTEHVGEAANTRMSRIVSYLGLSVTSQGSTFDGMASQKDLGKAPLEHLREIERTESGKLLASRSLAALIFQSRDVRYNPTAAASIAYADLDTGGVEMADDDQQMINTVVASRPGGATQRVINQTARDTYGPYQRELELFKSTDLKVTDAANWIVSRHADPPPELRAVPVEASTLGLTTYRALLNADVSTVLDITSMPDQAPASTQTVTIEGYTETITQEQHKFAFHTSRALTDAVWILDSATYSQLGITTKLAY